MGKGKYFTEGRGMSRESKDLWSPNDVPVTFGSFNPVDTGLASKTIPELDRTIRKPRIDQRSEIKIEYPDLDGNVGDDEAEESKHSQSKLSKKRSKSNRKKTHGLESVNDRDPNHLESPPTFVSNVRAKIGGLEGVDQAQDMDPNDGDIEESPAVKSPDRAAANHTRHSKRDRDDIHFGKVGGRHKGHQLLHIDSQLVPKKKAFEGKFKETTPHRVSSAMVNPFSLLTLESD